MSIYDNIRKITQIPQTNENPLFIPRKGQNTFKKSRKLRKVKPPKNENLYDFDHIEGPSQMCKDVLQDICVNEHEIALSIREANCGINYSNQELEEQWKSRQMGTSLIADAKLKRKKATEEEEYVLRKCGLDKNVVIRGLLKNHTISLKDLQVPNDFTNDELESNISTQDKSNCSQNSTNEQKSMTLVQCPDEPEVFVQPLQAYGTIDETKYKDIDFTVPRLGKKKMVTPRQFFVDIDDSDFHFVKKNTKKK